MRHLVTGGAGFIGSHLIDQLMNDEHSQVICIDNFHTGCRSNLAQWLSHPRFELIRHDVAEPIRLEVDQIWHLACPASPQHYQYNPITTAKTCVLGTLNMLGLAKRCNARLLFASTSEVYGNPLTSPQSETDLGNVNCTGPRACYDEGKRMGETLCFDYARKHNVSITVARIFNTYGPRMSSSDGRVVTNFMTQALQGEPLTIYGSGAQTRSFCYVADLIRGLIALMNSDAQGPINLGNPHEITISELADRIRALVNPALDVIYEALPTDDPERRRPAIERAQAELHWQPTVDLSDGLQATLADLRSQLKEQVLQEV
jgi:UDP-glucuronate decarboxylase